MEPKPMPKKQKKMALSFGKGITIISIDGQWLKIIHAKGPAKARKIVFMEAKPLKNLKDDEILPALQESFDLGGLDTKDVFFAVPSQFLTTRLLMLPSTSVSELHDMVDLQAEKHTPHAKEETLTDFQVIEKDKEGYSRVLLITTHQDVVFQAVKQMDGIKGTLERVGSDLEGIANWFRITHGQSLQDALAGATFLADMDGDTTTFMVFRQGQPYFHRNVPIGLSQLLGEDSESFRQQFLDEVQRSLETFDAEGLEIHCMQAFLTGQAHRVPGLCEDVEKETHLTTKYSDPFEKCHIDSDIDFSKDHKDKVSFNSLLGLALMPSAGDLMPPALKLRKSFEKRAKALITLGFQVFIGLILAACLLFETAHKELKIHSWLSTQHKKMSFEADKVHLLIEQIRIVQDRLSKRGYLLDSVMEVNWLTPAVIRWNNMTFNQGERLVISGVSKEMPKVFELVTDLEKSPLFNKPEAKRVSKRKIKGEDITDYEIICPFVEIA